MEQFFQQVEKFKSVLDKLARVAQGTAADDINLGELRGDLEALANATFAGDVLSGAQRIARREAFDFVAACSRAIDHHGLDRASYYTKAAQNIDVHKERLDYYQTALRLYDNVKPNK